LITGGDQTIDVISSNDRKIETIIEKMCGFASFDLLTFMVQNAGYTSLYD